MANRYRREHSLPCFSALLGGAAFPVFVANPRTVRLSNSVVSHPSGKRVCELASTLFLKRLSGAEVF